MNLRGRRRLAVGRRGDALRLAIRVAQNIKGRQLAHAFVIVRSAGYRLRVNKIDGVLLETLGGDKDISVDVINGVVKAARVAS